MILVSPECVLKLMGVNPSLGDSTESVEQVLEVVTQSLAGALDTPLNFAERQDYFNYIPSKYSTSYQPLLLILTQSFVHTPVTVTVGTTGTVGTSGLLLTEGDDYTVNAEYGTVRLVSPPPRGYSTIMVTYKAGFTGEKDVNVPSWLSAAAMKEAVSQVQSTQIGYNRKEMRDKSGFLDRAAKRMLDDHYRPRVGEHPESSVVI